jgi:hypothetical protein
VWRPGPLPSAHPTCGGLAPEMTLPAWLRRHVRCCAGSAAAVAAAAGEVRLRPCCCRLTATQGVWDGAATAAAAAPAAIAPLLVLVLLVGALPGQTEAALRRLGKMAAACCGGCGCCSSCAPAGLAWHQHPQEDLGPQGTRPRLETAPPVTSAQDGQGTAEDTQCKQDKLLQHTHTSYCLI